MNPCSSICKNSETSSVLKPALHLIHILEDSLLIALLLSMVLLASGQIMLRNFFDMGLVWIDPLLRVLVLWVGMLGALAATRGRRQISIDVLAHVSGQRLQLAAGLVTSLFTALVCAVVAVHSARFVAGCGRTLGDQEHHADEQAQFGDWSCGDATPGGK